MHAHDPVVLLQEQVRQTYLVPRHSELADEHQRLPGLWIYWPCRRLKPHGLPSELGHRLRHRLVGFPQTYLQPRQERSFVGALSLTRRSRDHIRTVRHGTDTARGTVTTGNSHDPNETP
ncbi:hypothetical protein J2S54_006882 [Streptomyces sp. DSM 42143]|nr:hypothetical protein [Streptomyces sp. DSM 42143]